MVNRLCIGNASFGAVLMLFAAIWMIQIYWKVRNSQATNEKRMPLSMGIFAFSMTLIALYGYYSKCSKIRIFWDYDFVLHYSHQSQEITMEIFYIFCVIIYLIVQLPFLVIVLPSNRISLRAKWFFFTVLFLNALQKVVFESIVAHMEMCEEVNKKKEKRCPTYMHYNSSINDLSEHQKKVYYSTKDFEPFTYTITMELFVACIGLVFAFNHHNEQVVVDVEQPEIEVEEALPQIEEIQPSWLGTIITGVCYFLLIIFPLYVIYKIPVNIATHQYFTTNIFQVIRFVIHLANLFLTAYVCWIYKISVAKLGINWSEPDILILWVAWGINLVRVIAKCIAELIFYWPYLNSSFEVISRIFATSGNFCETISFYFLIFIVEYFLRIAEHSSNGNARPHLGTYGLVFLPVYFCISLIAFIAYYIGHMYQIEPNEKIDSDFGLNLLVLLQTAYPTIMLSTMTVCLCIGTCLVELYQNGYYDFNIRNRNVQPDNH